MADSVKVSVGENSAEQVAYKLMHDIMVAEKRHLVSDDAEKRADREYLLTLYLRCRKAVAGITSAPEIPMVAPR